MTGDNHEQSVAPTSTSSSSDTEDVSIAKPCVRWSYLKTPQGYVKALQMVLSLFGLTCFATTTLASTLYSTWFVAVAISGLTFTGALLAFHLVGVDEKYPNFPWLKTEFVLSADLAVCHYVAACTIAIFASKANALIFAAAAFFSFGTIAAYAVDAWLKYREIRARKSDPKSMIEEIAV